MRKPQSPSGASSRPHPPRPQGGQPSAARPFAAVSCSLLPLPPCLPTASSSSGPPHATSRRPRPRRTAPDSAAQCFVARPLAPRPGFPDTNAIAAPCPWPHRNSGRNLSRRPGFQPLATFAVQADASPLPSGRHVEKLEQREHVWEALAAASVLRLPMQVGLRAPVACNQLLPAPECGPTLRLLPAGLRTRVHQKPAALRVERLPPAQASGAHTWTFGAVASPSTRPCVGARPPSAAGLPSVQVPLLPLLL
mmetsp:Transcript_55274/g.119373  ORF Transcript_55274/g.119373 Transcript_55274/m.119373 type:complete len:251 (+) Transcript_55274:121-873(+)